MPKIQAKIFTKILHLQQSVNGILSHKIVWEAEEDKENLSIFSAFLIKKYLENILHSMYMQISLNNNMLYLKISKKKILQRKNKSEEP